jgi:hypothetical protein
MERGWWIRKNLRPNELLSTVHWVVTRLGAISFIRCSAKKPILGTDENVNLKKADWPRASSAKQWASDPIHPLGRLLAHRSYQ